MTDVVFSEAEYAVLRGRINAYTTFLQEKIAQYVSILDYLTNTAIHDEVITASIFRLKSDVAMYTERLETIREETNQLFSTMEEAFREADKINLPNPAVSQIKGILSVFQ